MKHYITFAALAVVIASQAANAQDSLYSRRKGKLVGYTDGYRLYSAKHEKLTELAPSNLSAGGTLLVPLPKTKRQYYLLHLNDQGRPTGTHWIAVRGDSLAVLRGFALMDSSFQITLTKKGHMWQALVAQQGQQWQMELPARKDERLNSLLSNRAVAFDGDIPLNQHEVSGQVHQIQSGINNKRNEVVKQQDQLRQAYDQRQRARTQIQKSTNNAKQQVSELPSRASNDAKAAASNVVAKGLGQVTAIARLPKLIMAQNQPPTWARIDTSRKALGLPQPPALPVVNQQDQSIQQLISRRHNTAQVGQPDLSNRSAVSQDASLDKTGKSDETTTQKEANSSSSFVSGAGARTAAVWAFGDGGGLQFLPEGIRIFTGASIRQLEGSASLADSNGNLLAYTDGKHLWDAQNQIITDRLTGHASTTQGALFAPVAGTSDQFWLFTLDQGGYTGPSQGLSATHIQLTNRRGRLLSDPIQLDRRMTEKLAAIAHPDGQSVWVIGHRSFSNAFLAWRVTASGISAPVVSSVGSYHSGFGNATIGQMKLSADGRYLAVAMTGASRVELFTFNPETGEVTDSIPLPNLGHVPQAYGVEFSPSGRYLYVSGWYDSKIRRFDLQDTLANLVELAADTTAGWTCNALQLAPDGQIYIALMDGPVGVGAPYVGRIAHPDRGGVFQLQAISLPSGARSRFGLPSFLASAVAPPKTDFAADNLCVGLPTTFRNRSTSPESSTQWLWRFGDGEISTHPHPIHRYDKPGTYEVELVRIQANRRDSVRHLLRLSLPPDVALGPNRTLPADGAALNLGPIQSQRQVKYKWNTGAETATIDVHAAGTYQLTAVNGECSCSDTVQVFPQPTQVQLQWNSEELTTNSSINGQSTSGTASATRKTLFHFTPTLSMWPRGGMSFQPYRQNTYTGNPENSVSQRSTIRLQGNYNLPIVFFPGFQISF